MVGMTVMMEEFFLARYQYAADYVPDWSVFKTSVLNKTVMPHQIEWQPGPATDKLCWLPCPHCYGGSAQAVSDRLPLDRALDVLTEMIDGGVQKIIFAGYATDPLHSPDFDYLFNAAVCRGITVGINTKALKVSDALLNSLESGMMHRKSYVSVSVDAGSDAIYGIVHQGVYGTGLYRRVLENVEALSQVRRGWLLRPFELAATYLVFRENARLGEMQRFVQDFREAGCDVLRFAFPQEPRGNCATDLLLTPDERLRWADMIQTVTDKESSAECQTMFSDTDQERDLIGQSRTFPCVSRFVFPTIGYDGWLYPCSQSAAPDFRPIALGNLADKGFWDLYYDYPAEQMAEWMARQEAWMADCGCRCDRKAHLLNSDAGRSGAFGR
jgi:MoaA/NifB/PqqE/SkfB family radical SAM enzyme